LFGHILLSQSFYKNTMQDLSIEISQKANLPVRGVKAILELFDEGATIPFIARYRKDRTGNLDEVAIGMVEMLQKQLDEFYHRKEVIIKSITEQDKMTDAIQAKLDAATTLVELEDIYLPFKPKRRTKAQIARENGLEPLAYVIEGLQERNLDKVASSYINDKVLTADDALAGARDIIAEWLSEDTEVRNKVRRKFERFGKVSAKVWPDKKEDGIKYKDYFEYSELVSKMPSHRILALYRGVMEGFLRMSIEPEEEFVIQDMERSFIEGSGPCQDQYKKAIKDCYKRLLQPQFESEFRMLLREKAEEEAINVFAENLRQLLLSSPLGPKRVLAIDPGIRTGCKIVCLDEKGDFQKSDLIFLLDNAVKNEEAAHKLKYLVDKYRIEAFAIGDGTAGRETEKFVRSIDFGKVVSLYMVNEDGASVYSASEVAREEFPKEDVTVRGAISIGRRLMDPLAELVKIDPKAIGVGQYQHDVNQFRLKDKLDQTVVSCVNAVGVNLNTASKQLLSYVSGIGPTLAENIVSYRTEAGRFTSRRQLKEVPRLGDKAYEQCAGFLRIKEGDNALDASAVHPESYSLVEKIAKDLGTNVRQLIGNEELITSVKIESYITATIGTHTLQDILNELRKSGLDPRSEVEQFEFSHEVFKIEDVKVGMILPGNVTNITRFGAFVDVGVKQDGMVHISQIADKFIKDPSDALKLNQKVMVKVIEVDVARKRINLTMKPSMMT
jgi:uncharacterized protein